MAEIKLTATLREATGKGPARRARTAGRVPATVYGRDMETMSITVDRRELLTALRTEAGMNVLLDVEIDGSKTLVITRELQRDPMKGTVLHADFVKIDRTRKIEVEVPVHLVGEAPGAKEGGVLEQPLFQVRVSCLPTDVPERIDADISGLAIGDALRAEELAVPEEVEILEDPDTTVASVAAPITEEELEAMVAEAGIEEEAPEEVAEEEVEAPEAAEGEAPAEGAEEEQPPPEAAKEGERGNR
jgi:large subunit ribosomal protein L25